MKYLYVLASDENDYYLEQALLSITSLKMQMRDSFVSLLVDNRTESALSGKRRNILELIDELKIVKIDDSFNKRARSRWLKTSMRHHITGDFLYIDCDTVIVDDLAEIEDLNIGLGAVYNEHLLLSDRFKYNSLTKKHMRSRDKKLNFISTFQSDIYFNSGVIFCQDSLMNHDFFHAWHELWIASNSRGVTEDQPSLNQVNLNFDNLMKEIEGIWNCQIHAGGIRYLENAKIIHSFTSTRLGCSYQLGDVSMLHIIKENGAITQDIKEILRHPKTVFMPNTRLIADTKVLMIISSTVFSMFLIMPERLFAFFNRMLICMKSFLRIFGLSFKEGKLFMFDKIVSNMPPSPPRKEKT